MLGDGFGIYVNREKNCAVRISSPYWIPEGPDWTLVTAETNATLTEIRRLAQEKDLVEKPEVLSWGDFARLARGRSRGGE